jgi:predicted DNA-binding protein
MENLLPDKETKAIRIERDLIDQINQLREGTERNFSQQVKFMLRKYIQMMEKN